MEVEYSRRGDVVENRNGRRHQEDGMLGGGAEMGQVEEPVGEGDADEVAGERRESGRGQWNPAQVERAG
jgi:hypothetical protein